MKVTLNTIIVDFLKKSADIVECVIPPNSAIYTFIAQLMIKLTTKPRLQKRKALKIDVSLVDHCNLNCVGCQNFSPLAPVGEFLSIEEFERDMKQLAYLMNNSIEILNPMGREPLLHPRITEFCQIVRNNFPVGEIHIITNGILLTKMPDTFWESCKENSIKIYITKYPIRLDMDLIIAIMKRYNLELGNWNGEKIKTMWKTPLDVSGGQDPKKSFYMCHRANRCMCLVHGRIYPCPVSGYSFYMNEYFACTFKIEDADFVDIYRITDIDVLYEFLTKPVPFCRYCKTSKTQYGIKWAVSKKELSEWV